MITHVSLKPELTLKETVQGFAVLARIATIDPIVWAHHTWYAAFDSILEWPKIELVNRTIIDIRGHRLNDLAVGAYTWITLRFLLVGYEI